MELRPIIAMPSTHHNVKFHTQANFFLRLLPSHRFVLGMALVIALGFPELYHWRADGADFAGAVFGALEEPSFWATGAAIVAAHLFLNQIGNLPLVPSRMIIIPTFFVAFGVLAIGLHSTKMPYGRFHLWTGITLGIAWYIAISVLRGHYLRPTIGLFGISRGRMGHLPGNIKWVVLNKPFLQYPVDAVVVDPHAKLDVEHAKFITGLVLDGVPVYHRSHIEEGLTGQVEFHSHADNNFGALLPSSNYGKLKRVIDLLGCAILIVPFVLAIAFAAMLIKLDSAGPAFYNAPRTGYRGRRFICYKLRSMSVDHGGAAFTFENDPRVTRVGAYLRKWRIDELPQILNVIKGEMSWIGPRPEAATLAELYSVQIPFYDYRHAVRPGLSGWAAVQQGNVGDVDAAREKLKYDFYYIKYFSVWLDTLIVLKTLQTILTGFGSR